jgi:hypothetical protein
MELGLKVTVCAFPCPEADKEIAELKPPETAVVIVAVPDLIRIRVEMIGYFLRRYREDIVKRRTIESDIETQLAALEQA